jgi:hypothetical protein
MVIEGNLLLFLQTATAVCSCSEAGGGNMEPLAAAAFLFSPA